MKTAKIIGAWAVAAAMAFSHLPAMAAANNTEASETMMTVLSVVKSKVYVAPELTEFTSSSDTYDGNTKYSFRWYDTERNNTLRINADEKGRITSYNMSVSNRDYSQRLPGVSREAASIFAQEFLTGLVPDAMNNENDRLVCELSDNSYDYYGGSGYSFSFVRYKDGEKVANNGASVRVNVDGTDMSVEYADIYFDYDAVFEVAKDEISDPLNSYKAVFPAEAVYTDMLAKERRADGSYDTEIRLVYRIKDYAPGFISAYTGEEITQSEDKATPLYANKTEMAADAAGALNDVAFTRAELAEIENIANLYSEEESEKLLRGFKELKIDDTMKPDSTHLYLSDEENKEYTRVINLTNEENTRYVHATFDAVRGIVMSVSNERNIYDYRADAPPKTQEQLEKASALVDSFLDSAVGERFEEYKTDGPNEGTQYVSKSYTRIGNGLPYVNDTIYISADENMVMQYRMNYNVHGEFSDPADIIDSDTAYAKLLEIAPLEKLYLKSKDEYKLVYHLATNPEIDAYTGENVNENDGYNYTVISYDDISGHWCEAAVNALRDYGIAFAGAELKADESITQADLVRVFLAGVYDKSLMGTDLEYVYERCYSMKLLDKEERKDTAYITREQAFEYMVRMMGYDSVAKLPDIYKVKYADGDMLSDGMLGYAAILSGMGIINGDGSVIRPADYITRAEALMMVYNYLTSSMR